MGRIDPGEVQLARGQRRQLGGGLVHDDDHEAIEAGRPAQLLGECAVGREDPPPVGLMRDETERAVAHRPAVPGRLPKPGEWNGIQQMTRNEDARSVSTSGIPGSGRARRSTSGRVIRRLRFDEAGQIAAPRIPGFRRAGRGQRPGRVLCGRPDAVVPGKAGEDREGEDGAVRRPRPAARQVWHRPEQAVVAD